MAANSHRILLVDDESDIVTVFKNSLQLFGFEVDAFTNPVEALERFNENYYNMLLLDIRMPEMSGFELYEKIKAIDIKPKIAFMTAREQLGQQLTNLNVNLVIRKPIAVSKLSQIIFDELKGN